MNTSINLRLSRTLETLKTSDLRFALLSQLLTVLCLLLVIPTDYINPFNTSWIHGSGDFEQHYIGWLFYKNTPLFTLPLFSISAYGDIVNNSIIYTDSIPFAAFIAKIFSRIIDKDFQYFGIYSFISLLLASLFAYRYLLLSGVGRHIASFVCILFAITPVILFRTTGHTALTSHWLIIYALLLLKSNQYRPFKWYLVLQLALLTHLYLFVIVLCILVSGSIDYFHRQQAQPTPLNITRVFILFSTFIASLFAYGYLPLTPSDATASGYGVFSLNLLSPITPHGYSQLIPDIQTHYGSHEGITFPGISLLTINLALFFSSRARKYVLSELYHNKVLTITLITLALFAITPQIHLGTLVFDLGRMPYPLYILGDIFRASGRFAWPAFYFYYLTLAAAFCLLLQRLFTNKTTTALCIFMVVVSLIDLSGFSTERKDFFLKRTTEHRDKPEIETIQTIVTNPNVKRIIFYPNVEEPKGWNEIAPLAATNKLTTTGTSLARYNKRLMELQNIESRKVLLKKIVSQDLYVINDSQFFKHLQSLYPACSTTPHRKDLLSSEHSCWLKTNSHNLIVPNVGTTH